MSILPQLVILQQELRRRVRVLRRRIPHAVRRRPHRIMRFVRKVTRVADLARRGRDFLPIDRAQVRRQMLIVEAVVVLDVRRLQPLTQHADRMRLSQPAGGRAPYPSTRRTADD